MQIQFIPIDILILIAFGLVGTAALRMILTDLSPLTCLSLGMPLGGFLFAFTLFIAASLGFPISLLTALVTLMFLLLTFIFLGPKIKIHWQEPSIPPAVRTSKENSTVSILFYATLGLAFLAAVALSIGLSYHSWDAIATWALGSYGMVFRQSILGAAEFGNGVIQYPMNVQLQITLFRLIDGDILPGSKMLFPMYYLALLLGVYEFMLYWNVHKTLAKIGVLLVASTPIVFYHAYIGYTNLAFTVYFVLGVFWLVRGFYGNQPRASFLGGALMAAGLWTRPEGLALTLLTLLAAGLLLRWQGELKRSYFITLVPVILVYAAWKILLPETQETWNVSPPIDFTRTAWQGLLEGQFHLEAVAVIFRYIAGQVIRFRDFGILAIASVISLLVGFRWKQLVSEKRLQCLWSITIVSGIAIFAAHYIGVYQPGGSDFLYEWLSLEFTRVALPVLVLFFVLSQISLNDVFTSIFPPGVKRQSALARETRRADAPEETPAG